MVANIQYLNRMNICQYKLNRHLMDDKFLNFLMILIKIHLYSIKLNPESNELIKQI